MITLLTGPPGVGKSSLARKLAERNQGVQAISFGELLRKAVERRLGAPLDYSVFRTSAASLVTNKDLEEVANLLVGNPVSSDPSRWLVVDSHAVARERCGWHANPDTPDTLERYGYSSIVLLDAPTRVILRRIRKSPDGRLIKTRRDVSILCALQRSIATYYSGTLGCPLWVIDARRGVNQVAEAVESALGLRKS